jgi:Ala-tRNA(Pro) deacylase
LIPDPILRYLEAARAPFDRHIHSRAFSAEELAESLGVGGYQVAKTVVIEADGRNWLAVLPAPSVVDVDRLRAALGSRVIRLLGAGELPPLFPECRAGAEPPLGGLFGMPVVLDEDLAEEPRLFFRAGSHEEAISMKYQDFERLERPLLAAFSAGAPAQPLAGAQA